MLDRFAAVGLRLSEWGIHPRNPGIILLAAVVVPGIEQGTVVFPTQFKVMGVVRGNVGIDSMIPQLSLKSPVEGLHSSPPAFQEIHASGKNIPPGRHTGGGGNKMIIKPDCLLCKCIHARRNPLRILIIGF